MSGSHQWKMILMAKGERTIIVILLINGLVIRGSAINRKTWIALQLNTTN